MVYFRSPDTGATTDAVTSNGGMVGQEPFDVPGVGRIAIYHDPQGGAFSTMEPES
jgi:predicted enzyme related to lactoylglutathione lyase